MITRAIGILIAGMAGAAVAEIPAVLSVETFVLPKTSLQLLAPSNVTYNLAKARKNGLPDTDLPSIGSGLALRPDGVLFGLTDRGPNTTGKKEAKDKRLFPLPEFCPAIVRIALTNGAVKIEQAIPLKGADGKPLTGLNNSADEEPAFATAKDAIPLPPDPGAVDPEGLACLLDGRFLVSEEYSPSILVVGADGQVLVRYTPQSKPLTDAPYPVKSILPDVLTNRRTNRGFESIAVSADGKTAYAILQSPMGDADDARFADSRRVRVLEMDFSDPLDARVAGMFMVNADPFTDFPECKRQDQVKLNDAKWIGPRRLLVLEQAKGRARVLLADFTQATSLLGHPEVEALRIEEAASELDGFRIRAARTTTIFDTANAPTIDSDKLEGLALAAPDVLLLSNDNDFGIGDNTTGAPSKIWRVRFSTPFY